MDRSARRRCVSCRGYTVIRTGWSSCIALDSYSESTRFESQLRHRVSWGSSWFSSVPPSKCRGSSSISHDCIGQNPFLFTSHPTTRRYLLPVLTAPWNNPQEMYNNVASNEIGCSHVRWREKYTEDDSSLKGPIHDQSVAQHCVLCNCLTVYGADWQFAQSVA
jgi:hypothetical protein